MAKFKCIHTGCVYEWTEEETIATMRKHSEYKEVVEAPVEEKAPPKKATKDEK
jgi:hypothetical protein